MRALPGVEETALSASAPFHNVVIPNRVRVAEDGADAVEIRAADAWVSPEYFATVGVRLLAGRTVRSDEMFHRLTSGPEPVAIVSRAVARRLFGTDDPIGRRIASQLPGPPARVIGVAEDSRWSSLADEGREPLVYRPLPSAAA
nr:hypothetical protein [Gammaproteobacteria bacterium]